MLLPTFEAQHIPFSKINYIAENMKCEHETIGMELQDFSYRDHFYLSDVHPGTSWSVIKGWKNNLRGAYLIQSNDTPVVNVYYYI